MAAIGIGTEQRFKVLTKENVLRTNVVVYDMEEESVHTFGMPSIEGKVMTEASMDVAAVSK